VLLFAVVIDRSAATETEQVAKHTDLRAMVADLVQRRCDNLRAGTHRPGSAIAPEPSRLLELFVRCGPKSNVERPPPGSHRPDRLRSRREDHIDNLVDFCIFEWLEQLTERGHFENDVAGRFSCGFGVRPAEVIPFFDEFGIEPVTLLAAESLSIGLQGSLADLSANDPDAYAVALNLMLDAASDPSIHGMSNHLLYVGRRG